MLTSDSNGSEKWFPNPFLFGARFLLRFLELSNDLFERRDHFVLAGVALVELQPQVEGFGRRLEGKHKRLRPSGLGFLGFLAELFAGCALARDLLDERQHLRRVALADDLQQQRSVGDAGQSTDLTDLWRN